jgi:sulfopyruvate decarboxylase subunit beta
MTRMDALRIVAEQLRPEWLVVICNGMIGRELWTIGDQPNRFYMIGSMGLASTIGLGVALKQPDKKVVVVDGDGNVLMNLGALGNVAQLAPANFHHLVLDNGVHGSTGGQRTVSDAVAIEAVASACGYRHAERVSHEEGLRASLAGFFDRTGPAMRLAKVEPTANAHGIARVEIEPPALAERFRSVAIAR